MEAQYYIFGYGKCATIPFCSHSRREGDPVSIGAKKCPDLFKGGEHEKTLSQKFFPLNIQMAKTRRSRGKKGTRKLSSWNLLVMKTFKEMKAKNKNASFSDALKEASKRKK